MMVLFHMRLGGEVVIASLADDPLAPSIHMGSSLG